LQSKIAQFVIPGDPPQLIEMVIQSVHVDAISPSVAISQMTIVADLTRFISSAIEKLWPWATPEYTLCEELDMHDACSQCMIYFKNA
jgi:hypothetical protein